MAEEAPFPEDHRQTDLGPVAAVSDVGLRHADNQDAYAIETSGRRAVAAVCDGVSSAWRADIAARVAADAGVEALRPLLTGDWPDAAGLVQTLRDAAARAEKAVTAVPTPEGATTATTLVLAAVGPGVAAVGNVGDSRAYWVDTGRGYHQAVTVDDSWAEQAIREGVPAVLAYTSPMAHVITRALRSDSDLAEPIVPNVALLEVTSPGVLVVCTDGLWNYAEEPDRLASLAAVTADDTPIAIAKRLVGRALEAGGSDNITVAVVPTDPDGVIPRP